MILGTRLVPQIRLEFVFFEFIPGAFSASFSAFTSKDSLKMFQAAGDYQTPKLLSQSWAATPPSPGEIVMVPRIGDPQSEYITSWVSLLDNR